MAVIELTESNFDNEALQSSEPVLVDFWAPWCGPCRMLSPIVEEIGLELAGRVKVGKVNVDEAPSLAKAYGVMSIPTLVLIKGGEVAGKLVGARPKADIMGLLGL